MINNLIRKNLLTLKPYTCARDLYGEGMFLDANENSFGSSVKIPYKNELNRYPDPYCLDLKKAILGYLSLSFLDVKNIFVGSGSDEIIRLLMTLFLDDGDEIIINEPTYGMYRVAADISGANVVGVELGDDFQLNLEALKEVIGKRTKLIFCCSPNNPTGNLLKANDVVELCDSFDGYVVLDEAYVEFSSQGSLVKMLESCPNLLILRTFSKAWGLAGLRLGYMVGNEELISYLNKIKLPYNVNSLSQSLAIRALENVGRMAEVIDQILDARAWLERGLRNLGLKVFPSEANFLMVKVDGGGCDDLASRIVKSLAEQEGIVVRDFSSKSRLKNCFRVTVGTPKQNELLIQSLTSIL
jgi:histidinol-phosphate aminotransferase